MGSYDAKAHADTIEYYRLTLEARKRDPHAVEAAKADAETLEMVKKTPDLIEMNRQFMEGGLSFRLGRAMAVDGARFQAEVYAEMKLDELAGIWNARADAISKAADFNEIDSVSARFAGDESKILEKISRTKTLMDEIAESTFFVSAAKPGSELSESTQTKLEAGLKELAERNPGGRFPDLLKLPWIRNRFTYTDAQIERLVEIFAHVNAECLGGRF
ncbi:MAG TPA: hypothetical protein VM054_05400 [bacterium]|nr:hypothetical protein [bacterium]